MDIESIQILFGHLKEKGKFPALDMKTKYSGNIPKYIFNLGARGCVMVKALRYKPVGRGFNSRLCH